MDSTDFIPNEAEVEVTPAYFQQGVKNLADTSENEKERTEIETQARGAVDDYKGRFDGQRAEWFDNEMGIVNLIDASWRSGLNKTSREIENEKGANTPEDWSRANTGSTLLYRQTRQKSSNLHAVMSTKDVPFKYDAISDSEFDAEQHAEDRAERLNLLAKWSMKQDRFNIKAINFSTQVYKYGNIPVMVEWIQELGTKKVTKPVFGEDGVTITGSEIEEIETAVVNRPTLSILPVESLYADTAIGNIQDQECVIVMSVVSITEIVEGIRNGIYRENLLEDLGTSQQWDGFSGIAENEQEKKRNRGMDRRPSNMGTGQYLKWEVFINLPIDEDEETWDVSKNVPVRYRMTMFGNQASDALVARIERNQEPDDSIPIELIHANPDDDDILYHISDYEVVRGNIAAESTIKNQLIDNNTLTNRPPLVEEEGAVRGNDRSFGPDARWKADDINAIKQFEVRSLAQENMTVLDYIKEDSNTANSIDKNMIGESFGARTTASEATTISSNSARPNLVNIEYISEQFLGFYAKRLQVLWDAYGRHDQTVQITNSEDKKVFVKPENLGGEYDIIIDIMDDMKEDEVKAQRLINGANVYAQNPQLAQTMDWQAFSNELSENLFGTNKFIVDNGSGDADEIARMNLIGILQNGQRPTINPNMNLKRHLELYKEERRRWVGQEEQNPNIALLDSVIEELTEAVQNQASGGGQAQQGQLPQAQAQLQQQLTSGALGQAG